jgi:hypothetical protein
LLRPDPATNNAFTYCLIEAAQRCQIEVLLPCALSNHYHAVLFDRWGRYPEFTEHFHKLVARSQNALRGRWENLDRRLIQTSSSSQQLDALVADAMILAIHIAVAPRVVGINPGRGSLAWIHHRGYWVGSQSIRASLGVATESTEVPVVDVADIETSCCWVLDEL